MIFLSLVGEGSIQAGVTDMPHPRMRAKIDAAVRDADHLGEKDAGAVALARALAAAIDESYVTDQGGVAYRKYLGWASPNLLNVLRSLGLTPDGSAKAGATRGRKTVSKLDELRASRVIRQAVENPPTNADGTPLVKALR
jgi:hypothetical protein